MYPRVSRGLGPCHSTLLIFNYETYHPNVTLVFLLVCNKVEDFGYWCVCGEEFELGSLEELEPSLKLIYH
jgi:hypothetical protein